MTFDISQLMEAIGTSVSEAQQNLENHATQRFLNYFGPSAHPHSGQAVQSGLPYPDEKQEGEAFLDEEDLGKEKIAAIRPLTTKIVMPSEEDLSKTTIVDVPLVTLANHMQMQLNQVTVKVKTKFEMDSMGAVKVDINSPVANGINSSDESGIKDSDSGMIEMVFHVSERPEGKSRVVQNIERLI